MTLIEVLAGLLILGTVLVAMVVARGRVTRQWADADRKIAAGKALDKMLASWMDGPTRSMPVPGAGSLSGADRCVWRSRWVTEPSAAQLSARIARVEVLDSNSRGNVPMLTVDLLVHIDPPRPATTQAEGAR